MIIKLTNEFIYQFESGYLKAIDIVKWLLEKHNFKTNTKIENAALMDLYVEIENQSYFIIDASIENDNLHLVLA